MYFTVDFMLENRYVEITVFCDPNSTQIEEERGIVSEEERGIIRVKEDNLTL